MKDISPLIKKPEFPRSSAYDDEWMLENQMGPNAVWLAEWVCGALDLKPGMRVLDLGCGKAMSSIFLAKEFGVHVTAADLWIEPGKNWNRAVEAGVSGLVFPLKAEAHALPFAEGFFDAVISVDAYQYFGTDELYIDYLSRFVRPGGLFGIVLVGLMREIDGGVPDGLPDCLTQPQKNGKAFWEPSCRSFKTPGFWKNLWDGSPMVKDVKAEAQSEGWRHWRDFEKALELSGKNIFPSDAEALERDMGNTIGFLRLTAVRTKEQGEDLYDPSLGARFGIDG